ncbi:hypothetical protein EPUL_006458 [Erysiphe pulchra]|uniref:Uncharacterized protein n=1 Tax=Erysiphe pulchra TaxID=225359 RepID=A0A2S4PJM8_9PEZI|nr:hypothetical protein EPUL_006458 [Erysiphe pulchra]
MSLMKFQEGEIEAMSILAARIERAICPQNLMNISAKQLYDHVLSVRDEGENTPWETAVRNLLTTKLTSTADNYCNEFLQHYLDTNSAAEKMPNPSAGSLSGDNKISFEVSAGLAGYLFVLGTDGIKWLDIWRQKKVYDTSNKYVSLDIMMSTLRQVAKGREGAAGQAQVATAPIGNRGNGDRASSVDPEALCSLCKHKIRNKHCFRQHPELRKQLKKNKGKAKASLGDMDEDTGPEEDRDRDYFALSAVARASSMKNKNRLLYDAGASHHFMRNKSDFVNLKKLFKPFGFDQAVRNSKLMYQGICLLQVGNLTLDLKNALYSPESSCNIISAV